MKAYVLHGVGDLRYEEVARPVPRADSVLVKVAAAGICGSDIPRIFYTGAHNMPLIPGHEFAGTVAELGESVDSKWQGKRVGIFPLIPCMECPQCKKKQYEMCHNYNYLGSRTDGGFAEYVVVPEWNLLELPEEVSSEQAAMLEPASVAMHAIRAMDVRPDESVAVCGLGTIGLLTAMHLKGMGIEKVYVLGNKEIQKTMAVRIGIKEDDFCDIGKESPKDWIRSKTAGEGVDVFFECVGKNETVILGLEAAASSGRVMLIGNPASDMVLGKAQYWEILRKQLAVKGTWNSSYLRDKADDWNLVLKAVREKRIRPQELITHRLTLESLQTGLDIMRDKSEEYVKIMAAFPPLV